MHTPTSLIHSVVSGAVNEPTPGVHKIALNPSVDGLLIVCVFVIRCGCGRKLTALGAGAVVQQNAMRLSVLQHPIIDTGPMALAPSLGIATLFVP